MSNRFVWADLSTFDLEQAQRFYGACFGWRHQDVGSGYHMAAVDGRPTAGLYSMPQKFVDMRMPSFWMSYVQVDDVHATVARAKELGARVELGPQEAPGGGQVALIRDPLGAGFTCFEGEDPGGKQAPHTPGRMVWNELHVSSLEPVADFYTPLFGWTLRPTATPGRHEILDRTGQAIAGIQVSSNDVKGDKEYWAVYFAVDDLDAAQRRVEEAGGSIVASQPLGERPALVAYDSQEAAFYLVTAEGGGRRTTSAGSGGAAQAPGGVTGAPSGTRWRAMTGLVLVALALVFEADWIWGLLFLLWVVPDLRSGSTHFLEHVERRRNPVVYWLIIATWSVLSILMLFGRWLW